MKKTLIITLASIIFLIGFFTINNALVNNRQDYMSYNSSLATEYDYTNLNYYNTSDYYNYLSEYDQVFPQGDPIVIEALSYTDVEGDIEYFDNYDGVDDVLLTEEYGKVTWDIYIMEEGFYNLNLNYFPYVGKSSTIERTLYINGEVPFEGAGNISFYRIWGNISDVRQDINGNDIRPSQIELPTWTSSYFNDHIGYVNDPYAFYFKKGVNTISLESVREPLLIKSIELVSITETNSYSDVLEEYNSLGYEEVLGTIDFIDAESPLYTTSPTLYPLNDRTSPLTEPSSPTLVKLNSIGGNNWRIAGDKITWDFEVEEDGLYNISMRVKQKLASGMSVSRNIYINDEIPFSEMENYAFEYSNSWRIQTLGTQDEEYLFYFEAGVVNTITMEVSLGSYGPLIAQIQSSIANLNELYREILIYTGPQPDPYRDYQLTERVDNLIERIEAEQVNLSNVREAIIEISGTKSEKTGILDTVILQLNDFLNKPSEIHKNLGTYNSNIKII